MAADLQRLRFLPVADVYKQGKLAARLTRTAAGGTAFSYDPAYLEARLPAGADVPGDVQIVPAGETPAEPDPLADTPDPSQLDFSTLAEAVDLHGLPGIQPKASASMVSAPLALGKGRYILKLDPPDHPHLVHNEALPLAAAKALKTPVSDASLIEDRNGWRSP